MESTLIVLYVADQGRSTVFYRAVLVSDPVLDVPGMTQFLLPGGATLGLMPFDAIRRLLPTLPHADGSGEASGAPRCELYLVVDDPSAFHRRALDSGATELDALAPRDWGDEAAYSLDPDGHVVAFAHPSG